MKLLELDGIIKTFGPGEPVLDGLSLAVAEGEIYGFLGINGAGKTTTIRIIAGLLQADSGEVRLFGRPVTPQSGEHLSRMGFVLDEPLYFDWMSPGEYWEFAGGMQGLDHATIARRVTELLEFLDLESKAHEPIVTLSTGMKKKVSLGAALIHRPRLIILDEPLEGIDALAARGIKEALHQAAREGTAILITSHMLDTVERFCTRVGILNQGRLILECAPAEVRTMARETSSGNTFSSLEELFVAVVAPDAVPKRIRFLHDE